MTLNDKHSTDLLKVALIPDKFAHYRYPVFEALSRWEDNAYELHIYADDNPNGNIKLADAKYCDLNYENGNVYWHLVKDKFVKGVCVWQRGIVPVGAKGEYDVLVFWGDAWRISTWFSAILARLKGKKVVFWTHGVYGNENILKLSLRLSFYRIANSLLLYGQHSKNMLAAKGFQQRNMFVINNSLDYKQQSENYNHLVGKPIKPIFPGDNSRRIFIFVGRLEAGKSLNMLITAIEHLGAAGKDVGLMLVGDGSCRNELEILSVKLGVSHKVIFYGACYDQKELSSLLMASDVCVSPGNVGLTAMQSLVYGTPVVTHDDPAKQMPEFEAVIEARSGALFTYGSQESLEQAMLRCLGYLDSGRVHASSCISVIEESYTPEFQTSVFKEMLKSLYK